MSLAHEIFRNNAWSVDRWRARRIMHNAVEHSSLWERLSFCLRRMKSTIATKREVQARCFPKAGDLVDNFLAKTLFLNLIFCSIPQLMFLMLIDYFYHQLSMFVVVHRLFFPLKTIYSKRKSGAFGSILTRHGRKGKEKTKMIKKCWAVKAYTAKGFFRKRTTT